MREARRRYPDRVRARAVAVDHVRPEAPQQPHRPNHRQGVPVSARVPLEDRHPGNPRPIEQRTPRRQQAHRHPATRESIEEVEHLGLATAPITPGIEMGHAKRRRA
jgi:hypothetical protein